MIDGPREITVPYPMRATRRASLAGLSFVNGDVLEANIHTEPPGLIVEAFGKGFEPISAAEAMEIKDRDHAHKLKATRWEFFLAGLAAGVSLMVLFAVFAPPL